MNGEIVNTYSTTLRRIIALVCTTHEPNNLFVSFDRPKMVRNETQPRDFVSSPSRSGIVLATQIRSRKSTREKWCSLVWYLCDSHKFGCFRKDEMRYNFRDFRWFPFETMRYQRSSLRCAWFSTRVFHENKLQYFPIVLSVVVPFKATKYKFG